MENSLRASSATPHCSGFWPGSADQVVTDPHGQLVELVPLLSQANGGVLRVPIVEDQLFLQDSSKILILA